VIGLLPVLKKFCALLPNGKVVPGFINRCAPRENRKLQLQLQAAPPPTGGFRFLARKGTTVQEVLVSTSADRLEVQAAALAACGEQAVRPPRLFEPASFASQQQQQQQQQQSRLFGNRPSTNSGGGGARLVLNHSTHAEGLFSSKEQ
jgi:hypothetical protein